jgi:hypothetical protein
LFESIFASSSGDTGISFSGLLASLGTALALGFLVSIVYRVTHKGKSPSQSFAITLVLLPAIITVIILLVGNNVARAFSLAGAFSIIRFRSTPGEAKDITYVLFSMAIGLATGMGFLFYAGIVGVVLCAAMLILELLKYGHPKGTEKKLKITVPEDLNFQDAFEDIMQKFTVSYKLKKLKTADLGSLYELDYEIVTKEGISEKAFLDELRCRNGNLNITLVLNSPEYSEF